MKNTKLFWILKYLFTATITNNVFRNWPTDKLNKTVSKYLPIIHVFRWSNILLAFISLCLLLLSNMYWLKNDRPQSHPNNKIGVQLYLQSLFKNIYLTNHMIITLKCTWICVCRFVPLHYNKITSVDFIEH